MLIDKKKHPDRGSYRHFLKVRQLIMWCAMLRKFYQVSCGIDNILKEGRVKVMSWDYHKCKCGQLYIVYVPKKLILEEGKGFGLEVIRAAEEIEERERKSGEIEAMKKCVQNIGAKFDGITASTGLNCKCG